MKQAQLAKEKFEHSPQALREKAQLIRFRNFLSSAGTCFSTNMARRRDARFAPARELVRQFLET
jgi:hypothetical protein